MHLSSSSSGKKQNGGGGFKNLEMFSDGTDDVERVGYTPVDSFLADLEAAYGDAVLFFKGEGEQEGGVIAGLFHPLSLEWRGWKVNLAVSTMPVVQKKGEEGAAVVEARVHREGMIQVMGRLGGDLVGRIEIL